MHLADAFIQSDLQCIQAIHYYFFLSMCVPWELNPWPFALLTQCSTTEPQEHRQQKNNIQIGNVQNSKNTMQYRSDVQIWNEKKINTNLYIYVWWINNCIIVLCVPRFMSSVHEMDCLGEETVPVSGRSGAQSSVASTRRQQFKEGVYWMWGVQSDFASPFAHSG